MQLLDSAGSTDSNYRATCQARSLDEFIAKIGVAAEEADESKGWLIPEAARRIEPPTALSATEVPIVNRQSPIAKSPNRQIANS